MLSSVLDHSNISIKWQALLLSSGAPPLVVAALSFGGYLPTLAPSITWKNGGIDSGELALAAAQLGVAHPTGYPLYVLLGHLCTWLPWGDPAFRLNLFSAVCAALAAGFLTFAAVLACPPELPPWGRSLAAAVAGLLLAFAPALWSQAVITEVYALHSLFVAAHVALLLALTHSRETSHTRRFLAVGCLVAGLSVAHHVTIVLLWPGSALYLWANRHRLPSLRPRDVGVGLLLFLVGSSPYLLLPLRASQQAIANWGDPQTPANFLAHLTARDYTRLFTETPWSTSLARVPAAAQLLLDQFGWPGFLLLTVGCWVLWHRDRPLLGHIALSCGLVLAQAARYAGRDSEVYLLPAYVLLALALGVGAATTLVALPSLVPAPQRARRRGGAPPILTPERVLALAAAGLALLPVVSYLQHRDTVDLHNDNEATIYAEEVLTSLPPSAVVVAQEDHETFSLWYAQDVLGLRPDVLVLNTRLLYWPWYRDNLQRRYPDLPWPARAPISPAQAVEVTAPRPVFFTYPDSQYATVAYGRVFALDRNTLPQTLPATRSP